MKLNLSKIFFLVSIVLSLLTILLFNQGQKWLLVVSGYFYIITLASIKFFKIKQNKSQSLFITSYLTTTMLRLLLHLIIMLILLYFMKEKYLIALLFLINYVIFSVFEVITLLSKK